MRTVILEVVANIDDNASEIVLLIHWIGGVHTELRLAKRRPGQRNSTAPEIIAAVRQLVLIASDDLIAGTLNRNGLLTGHGNRWTRERVTALRSHHKIPVFRPAPDGMAQPDQRRAPARRHNEDPQNRRRGRRHPRDSSATRWAVDLQSSGTPTSGVSAARSPSPTGHQTPHGTAPRSAIPLLFKYIDRWAL